MTGARERARTALTDEIKALARRQLAEGGAGSLSLRQIARDVGMVSSGIYRYVPSRDDLLTALIVDAYDAVGEVAEAAAAEGRGGFRSQWLRVAGAIRGWALAHRHDYELIYGTPIPGYRAPTDTVTPAQRVSLVALRIVQEGVERGEIAPARAVSIPRAVHADLVRLRDALLPGVSDDVLSRALAAWTMLFGTISFELFGHLHNVITDYDAFFELQMGRAADLIAGDGSA
jgi:AcrR family transcriptional regulator